MSEPTYDTVGVGEFTPPPAPCGNPLCRYVEFDCVHDSSCSKAAELIDTQPDLNIVHKWG